MILKIHEFSFSGKNFGRNRFILLLLTIIPTVGVVLSIAGFILILIAVKYISDSLGDRSIFNNMIIAVVLAIVGVVVAVVAVLASIFSFVGLGFFNGWSFGQNFNPSTIPQSDLISLIAGILLGLIVIWIFLIVSAIFLRKSYNVIGSKLGVGMFRTTALLWLIGAIIPVIGLVLIFVADILQIIAFFSIPDQTVQVQPPQGQPPQQV